MKKIGIGCLGIIGIFILLIIIVAVIGNGDENSSENNENEEEQVSEDNQEVSGSETEEIDEVETDEEGNEAAVFSSGEVVSVGDIDYTVLSTDTTNTLGSEFANTEASGVYYLMEVEVTNNGSEAVTISDSYVKLLLNGNTYDPDTSASIYANEDGFGLLSEQINPGSTVSGFVGFDVTEEVAEADDLQAQVQEGIFGSNTAIIDLD